jgi:hypothetical protein
MYAIEGYDEHRKSGFVVEHSGTITDINGNTYFFNKRNLVQNSGKLTRSSTSSNSFQIGSVQSSFVTFALKDTDIDRYLLYSPKGFGKVNLEGFIDNDSGYLLTNEEDYIDTDQDDRLLWDADIKIPFGEFNITEAIRKANSLTITAYDNMILFGKKEINKTDSIFNTGMKPYGWYTWICGQCGVKFGMTEVEVDALTNGTVVFHPDMTHTDDIKTFRDLLSHLATATASVALIGRDGKLYIKQYTRSPYITEYGAGDRFTSDLADFVSRYSGCNFTYYENGEDTTEYYHTADDKYLVFTVGTNAFLQIEDTTERTIACQSIMNALANAVYVPFSITALCDPCIDPMDVVHIKDNQATDYDIAVITEMVYSFGGKTTLKCSGKNPMLDNTKTITEKMMESVASRSQKAVSRTEALSFIAEAAKSINGVTGGSVVKWNSETRLPDNPNEIVWFDGDSVDTSNHILRSNYKGIGGTTNYSDETAYLFAIGIDGKINATAIQTGILNASIIRTGEIRDYKYVDGVLQAPTNYWNLNTGEFYTGLNKFFAITKDEEGNEVVELSKPDSNGVSTIKLRMRPDKISFMHNSDEIAYITGNIMNIAMTQVFEALNIDNKNSNDGMFRWFMRDNSHLSLVYISN